MKKQVNLGTLWSDMKDLYMFQFRYLSQDTQIVIQEFYMDGWDLAASGADVGEASINKHVLEGFQDYFNAVAVLQNKAS